MHASSTHKLTPQSATANLLAPTHSNGCGQAGSPGVYTRVASYRGWVDRKMKVR